MTPVTRHAKASSAGSTSGRGSRLDSIRRGALATRGASSGADGTGAPATSQRRTRSTLLALTVCALILGLVLAAGAQASKVVTGTFGTFGSGAGQFNTLRDVAVTTTSAGGATPGDLYVVDSTNHRIQQFTPNGDGTGATVVRAFGWGVVASGPDNHTPASAVQSLNIPFATIGAFTLSYNTQTTAALTATATATEVQTALRALTSIGSTGVNVTGGPLGTAPVTITFAGPLANTPVPQITADSTNLVGGTASVSTTTAGVSAFEVCNVAANPSDVCQQGRNQAATAGGGANGAGAMSAPQGVAVDPANGNLYVTDQGNRRVDAYSATGTFQGAFGWGVLTGAAQLEFCTTTCLVGLTGAGAGEFDAALGHPAIDPTTSPHHLYVADATNLRVDEFAPTLTAGVVTGASFVKAFGWDVVSSGPDDTGTGLEVCNVAANPTDVCKIGVSGGGAGQFYTAGGTPMPVSVAADSTGAVYAVDQYNGTVQPSDNCTAALPCRVMRFTFPGGGISAADFAPDQLTATSGTAANVNNYNVAVDPSNDHVFVAKKAGTNTTWSFLEFDSSGSGGPLDTSPPSPLTAISATNSGAHGLAVGPDDRLYFGDTSLVDILGTAPAPAASISSVINVGQTTATFRGAVTPPPPGSVGGYDTTYHFEYSTNGVTWTSFPSSEVDVGDTNAPISVSQNVTGLQPNATYLVRLVATTGTPTTSATTTFTTNPATPAVSNTLADPVGKTTAKLTAYVNPNNQGTTYHFEWGADTSYGNQLPADFELFVGSGGDPVKVTGNLSGLEANHTYHFRVLATNATGTTAGPDQAFTTLTTLNDAGLPDNRAYEMVTPPQKTTRVGPGGGVAGNDAAPGIVAADGQSVLFDVRFGVLGDPVSSFADDVSLSHRTAEGWSTESLMNATDLTPTVNVPPTGAQLGATTPDFTTQAFTLGGPIFDWQLPWGLQIFPYTYTRFGDARGWTAWVTDPSQVPSAGQERNIFSSDGRHEIRWGYYRGLAGASDPSTTGQLAGINGGSSIYDLDTATGALELVNACTGSGASATQIPAITGTKIGAQSCAAGQVVNSRGASGGAAGMGNGPGNLAGTATNAVSGDGARVFFSSPVPTGRQVIACSGAGATTSCPPQLYVRQRGPDGAAAVRWISRSTVANQDATLTGKGAGYEGASTDGSKVFFRTNAPLTADDPNAGAQVAGGVITGSASPISWDLYEYDLPTDRSADPATGTLTRITAGPTGAADPNVNCTQVSGASCSSTSTNGGGGAAARYISDDGSRVYFVTAAPIPGVAGATDGTSTAPGGAVNNVTTRNLYLYDSTKSGAARWEFIAQLPYTPPTQSNQIGAFLGCASAGALAVPVVQTSTTGLTPLGAAGDGANAASCFRGSRDGRMVVFQTAGQLTADDTDAASDVYVYDEQADKLTRASAPQGATAAAPYICIDRDGVPLVSCNGDLGFMTAPQNGSAYLSELTAGPSGYRHYNVSSPTADQADTAKDAVYFESRAQLVPEAQTPSASAPRGGWMNVYQWSNGKLSLVSPGNAAHDAYYSGNSVDGRDVVFQTSQPIDPREIDSGDYDIYDARIGGGFPMPAAAPAGCSALADACQAALTAPSLLAPTTTTNAPSLPAPTTPTFALAPVSAAARRSMAKTGKLTLTVSVSQPGTIVATATAKLGNSSRRVATVSRRLTHAGKAHLRLRLSKRARSTLARKHKLTVKLAVSYSKVPTRKAVTLKLTRAPSHTRQVVATGGRA